MEDLDLASERSELERETQVAAVRRRPGSGLLACGKCHFCDEEVSTGKLYCNSDCATDHAKEQRRRA